MSELLSLQEVAYLMGESEKMVRRYLKQGLIKAKSMFKDGKQIMQIPQEELEAFLGISVDADEEDEEDTEETSGEEKARRRKKLERMKTRSLSRLKDKDKEENFNRFLPGAKIVPEIDALLSDISKDVKTIVLPLDYFERQQKEREQLMQGLMFYRFRYEEVQRKMKLLPAPAENISSQMEEKDKALNQVKSKVDELEDKLRESIADNDKLNGQIRKLRTASQDLEVTIMKIENEARFVGEKMDEMKVEKKHIAEELEKTRLEKEKIERELQEAQLPWWKRLFRIRKNSSPS